MNTQTNPAIAKDTHHRVPNEIFPAEWASFTFLVSPGSNIDTPSVIIHKTVTLPRDMKGIPTTQGELFWADTLPDKFDLPQLFSLNAEQALKILELDATFESAVTFIKNGTGVLSSAGVMILASMKDEGLLKMGIAELTDFLTPTVRKMMMWEEVVPSFS